MSHAGMSGHAWPGAPAALAAMWMAMMVAMMLPSLAPALRDYHRMVERSGAATRFGRSTAAVAAAYYTVWVGVGVALLPLGTALAAAEARLPALAHVAPYMAGVVVLVAGAVQLTAWKARQLAHCRAAPTPGVTVSADVVLAWRHGVRLGVRCALSCAGPMAVLLALGAMSPIAMTVVTAAISAERLAPNGVSIARATGALAVGTGLLLVARAAGVA